MAFKMKAGKKGPLYKNFPDLNKDGDITQADILMGKGVIKSPMAKKVPNCIPRGSGENKLSKPSGDPCWDNYVQRGMKNK